MIKPTTVPAERHNEYIGAIVAARAWPGRVAAKQHTIARESLGDDRITDAVEDFLLEVFLFFYVVLQVMIDTFGVSLS